MLEKQDIDFQKYIDRLEQDRREMEKRLADDAREREQRSLEMERRLADDAREREQRSREVEQRLTASAVQTEERINAMEERINANAIQMEERLNANAERIEGKIDSFVAETKETLREAKVANRWFIGLNIAALIGATTIIIAFVNLLVNGNGM